MALYTITFSPSPGSLGTLVEFKPEGATDWIVPPAPANPTTLNEYPLYLDGGQNYDVRVSSVFPNCSPKYKYLFISTVSGVGINLYGKAQSSASLSVAQVYYSINAGATWIPTILATVGLGNTFMYNITPTPGDDLYFAVRSNLNANLTFGTGDGGGFTGFCGESAPYHYGVFSSPDNVYFNLEVLANAFVTC